MFPAIIVVHLLKTRAAKYKENKDLLRVYKEVQKIRATEEAFPSAALEEGQAGELVQQDEVRVLQQEHSHK